MPASSGSRKLVRFFAMVAAPVPTIAAILVIFLWFVSGELPAPTSSSLPRGLVEWLQGVVILALPSIPFALVMSALETIGKVSRALCGVALGVLLALGGMWLLTLPDGLDASDYQYLWFPLSVSGLAFGLDVVVIDWILPPKPGVRPS